MRQLTLKAGERQRVLHLVMDRMQTQTRFRAEPVNSTQSVSGEVHFEMPRWMPNKKEKQLPLQRENVVPMGVFQKPYSIYVTPDIVCEITFETRHFTARLMGIIFLCILAFGIGLPLILSVLVPLFE